VSDRGLTTPPPCHIPFSPVSPSAAVFPFPCSSPHLWRRRTQRPVLLPAPCPGLVIGIRPRQTWQLVGTESFPRHRRPPRTRELFAQHPLRQRSHTTGNCALKSCELNPRWLTAPTSRALSTSPAWPDDSALAWFICRLISSNSGSGAGGYVETDPVDPGDGLWQDHGRGVNVRWRRSIQRQRFFAFRCRWGRVSTARPARSTGSAPGSQIVRVPADDSHR